MEQNDHFHRDISVSGREKMSILNLALKMKQQWEMLVSEKTETMNEAMGKGKVQDM